MGLGTHSACFRKCLSVLIVGESPAGLMYPPALHCGRITGDTETFEEVLLTSVIDLGSVSGPMTCLITTERFLAQS